MDTLGIENNAYSICLVLAKFLENTKINIPAMNENISGLTDWNIISKCVSITIQACYIRKGKIQKPVTVTSEIRYQCPLCRKQVTLSSIGFHYHKKHPWAKVIPKLETLKPISASLPQPRTQPIKKRSEELKRMRASAVNQPYTLEDLKNDNINEGKRSFWPKIK